MADLLLALVSMLLFVVAAVAVFAFIALAVESLVWAFHKLIRDGYRWGDIVAPAGFDWPCACGNTSDKCPKRTGEGCG